MTIVRGQRSLQFPTRFMLVAATNPCPCGFAGVDDRCTCGEIELRRHRRRLSGPLLDRMDLLVDVRRPSDEELRSPPRSSSARARARVARSRELQRRRLSGTGASCNGEMDVRMVRQRVRLDEDAQAQLGRAYSMGMLSVRGRHRILRVAQTIADLADHPRVTGPDVLLALSLRQRTAADAAAVP